MDGANPFPWLELVIQLGSFGLVAFIIFYSLTRVLPKLFDQLRIMQTDFEASLQKQKDAGEKIIVSFLQQISEQRLVFTQELATIRINADGNMQRLFESIERGNRLLVFLISLIQRRPLTAEERDALDIPQPGARS